MPRFSGFTEHGEIIRPYKSVGDKIRVGDRIVEIKSETGIFELESFVEGVLLFIKEGNVISDEPIIIIGEKDEDWENELEKWKEKNSREIILSKLDFFHRKMAVILASQSEGKYDDLSFEEILDKFASFLIKMEK